MKNVLFILLLLPAFSSAAQYSQYKRTPPTPEDALRSLKTGDDDAAVVVLRQIYEERPAAELDAFAAALEELYLNGTEQEYRTARWALFSAGLEGGSGTRYARAKDVLIRMYESIKDQPGHPKAIMTLSAIKGTGGIAYVRRILETSEKPPRCVLVPDPYRDPALPPENVCPNKSTWCDAAAALNYLYLSFIDREEEEPDRDEYFPRCESAMKDSTGRWGYILF